MIIILNVKTKLIIILIVKREGDWFNTLFLANG